MKVTPLDIRRKEFKRSVRGYSDEEVDLFLDEVADDFERLFQENVELKDRIRQLEEQGATNAQLRDALEKTLVSAQIQADQTTANARKEGELILRDAELKARGIVGDSYAEVQRVQQALIQLKHLEEDFRFKFRSLLEGHLKLLEEAPINMAAQPVVVEPGPGQTDEQPFMVPTAMEDVPEYPGVPSAAKPGSPVAPETATGVLAAAVAGTAVPSEPAAASEPVAAPVQSPAADDTYSGSREGTATPVIDQPDSPVVWATEPLETTSSEAETVEQSSMFAEFDKADAERAEDETEEPTESTREEDPLSGFFFGNTVEGADEVFGDGEKGGNSKPRDFEW